MKQRILLLIVMTAVITTIQAQKKNKAAPGSTGYAITAVEKGGRSWKEVRQIDAASGAILKTIYDSKQETEALNARTGKPVLKKDNPVEKIYTRTLKTPPVEKKVVNSIMN